MDCRAEEIASERSSFARYSILRDTGAKDGVRGLDCEVDVDGFNEGCKPGEELLVEGADGVSVQGGAVGELHDGSEVVALRAGGEVVTGICFDQAGDLALKGEDLGEGAVFVGLGGFGFPAENEDVDDHGSV